MMEIKYTPIEIVHSPFKETKGTPIQPNAAKDGLRKMFTNCNNQKTTVDLVKESFLSYNICI
ncbi:hypothetical protein [Petrotoga mobilis]|jgi:tRNA (Thr-GGU) A37 N-methylase|uniref:hypothetical protein n=1 Tax=Petrotoga mobilis TaxID=69499 RepID=UPI0003077268|nr:hypothetical protein [Petrotoga mobilis]